MVASRRQDLKELPFVMLSLLIIPRRISLSADFTDGIALYLLHITCTFFAFASGPFCQVPNGATVIRFSPAFPAFPQPFPTYSFFSRAYVFGGKPNKCFPQKRALCNQRREAAAAAIATFCGGQFQMKLNPIN